MEGNKLSIKKDFWGQKLTAVEITYWPQEKPTKPLDIEKITFGFGSKSIVIAIVTDTDEVAVELVNRPAVNSLEAHSSLAKYIGKELSLAWKCVDFLNCFDMYIISFAYLRPDLIVLCEGNALLLFETNMLDNAKI